MTWTANSAPGCRNSSPSWNPQRVLFIWLQSPALRGRVRQVDFAGRLEATLPRSLHRDCRPDQVSANAHGQGVAGQDWPGRHPDAGRSFFRALTVIAAEGAPKILRIRDCVLSDVHLQDACIFVCSKRIADQSLPRRTARTARSNGRAKSARRKRHVHSTVRR